MATVTGSLFIALDGVVDPMLGNWHFPYFNEEMGDAVAGTHDADVMLFGRETYDSFAGAWPGREAAGGQDAAFAKRLGDVRKIVASRSPVTFTWRNSEQLQGELVDAVTALKEDGTVRRIVLSGSISVVRPHGQWQGLGTRMTARGGTGYPRRRPTKPKSRSFFNDTGPPRCTGPRGRLVLAGFELADQRLECRDLPVEGLPPGVRKLNPGAAAPALVALLDGDEPRLLQRWPIRLNHLTR